MFQLDRSLSMNTGLAPQWTTALALAANVRLDTSTSSPGCTPLTSRARCSAAVPLDSATAPGQPRERGDVALEAVELRSGGSHPPAVERAEEVLALERSDVRRAQMDARHQSSSTCSPRMRLRASKT